MSGKYDLMAQFTANMVAEILARRHGWELNTAISLFSKSDTYDTLIRSETGLWIDNPSDIADMYDMEIFDGVINQAYYFK